MANRVPPLRDFGRSKIRLPLDNRVETFLRNNLLGRFPMHIGFI